MRYGKTKGDKVGGKGAKESQIEMEKKVNKGRQREIKEAKGR